MLDILEREKANTLVEANRHRPGYVERQNGIWDDRFLCKVHEDLAGGGDEYVVKLSRRLHQARELPGAVGYTISNPDPIKLARFAYGTVWRHLMAPVSKQEPSRLGPYKDRIEQALFDNYPFDMPVLVAMANLRGHDGSRVPLGLYPHRVKLNGRTAWHFIVGLLEFYLKTDNQPWPKDWAFAFSDQDPLMLGQTDAFDLATVPMLREVTDRIRASPYRGKLKRPPSASGR